MALLIAEVSRGNDFLLQFPISVGMISKNMF